MGDKAMTGVSFLGGPIEGITMGQGTGAFDGPSGPKVPEPTDEAEAEAKKRERDRLRRGAGANSTRLSGSVSQALNATIGKRTLGGAI